MNTSFSWASFLLSLYRFNKTSPQYFYVGSIVPLELIIRNTANIIDLFPYYPRNVNCFFVFFSCQGLFLRFFTSGPKPFFTLFFHINKIFIHKLSWKMTYQPSKIRDQHYRRENVLFIDISRFQQFRSFPGSPFQGNHISAKLILQ